MDYDRWLEAPYEAKAKKEDIFEKSFGQHYTCAMNRPEETFYEFLQWFVEETDDKEIINAVKQRDFESLGGLLYARYESYVQESAERSAEYDSE